MNIEKLIPLAQKLHSEGTIIGFACSCFDLLNAGHYLMLKDARAQCNFLVVGLQTDLTLDEDYKNDTNDGKNKNVLIQSWEERLIQIEGCKYVGAVVKYTTEEDLYEILRKLKGFF